MNSIISEHTDKAATITKSSQDAIVKDEESSSEVTSVPSGSTTQQPSGKNLCASASGNKKEEADVEAASSSHSQVSNFSETSSALFTVSFRDERVAQEYRERIKEYLQTLVSSNSDLSVSCHSKLLLEVWNNDSSHKSQDLSTESENSQDSENNLLFTIDKQPAPKDDFNIPTYGKKYNKIYEKSGGEVAEEAKEDQFAHKIACFNCLGNHSLRECSQPLDHAVISKNRKEFSMNNNSRSTRYHLDNEQRFGHLVPGSLSKNLRKALGLKDNQLPRHIYRMRILGYPPGWLEEARLQHSGLSLFNSDGVAEKDPTEEPGEIFTDPGDKDQYDTKKIYDFPGFNVPPPPGTRDEHKQHWAPQMQPIHSKETMLSMLRGKKAEDGYKRKKLKVSTMSSTATDCQTTPTEMDLEEVTAGGIVETVPVNGHFIPPLPRDTMIKPPEPPTLSQPASEDSDGQSQEPLSPNSENDESTAPSSRTNSPSLSDLEHMKKRLLVELEDSSSQSNPGTPMRNDSAAARIDPKSERTPERSRTQDVRNASNTGQGSVKSVDLGTPVLQSTSPYSKLPSSDKFSKNICDVITYENLPDSTGKYMQLTGILQKVRDTLAKIHQDS